MVNTTFSKVFFVNYITFLRIKKYYLRYTFFEFPINCEIETFEGWGRQHVDAVYPTWVFGNMPCNHIVSLEGLVVRLESDSKEWEKKADEED